jgi:hypothetical protein
MKKCGKSSNRCVVQCSRGEGALRGGTGPPDRFLFAPIEPTRPEAGFHHRTLDAGRRVQPLGRMATPTDENFNDYKQAERKALEILREMKTASAKKTDIELALLVAVFELHKATLPAATITAIIQGHLKQLQPHYAAKPPVSGN